MYRKIVLDVLHREHEREQTIVVRKGDRSTIELDVTVTEGGESFDGSGFEPRMFAEFGGGRVVIDPVTEIDASTGRYSYALPAQFAAEAGRSLHAYLRFSAPGGSVCHSTDSIAVIVKDSVDLSPATANDWISEFDRLRGTFGDIVLGAETQKEHQQAEWLERMEYQRETYETAENARNERSDVAVGKILSDAESGKFDASIAVGRTETAPAGEPARVINVGTPKEAVFDFYVPRGRNGAITTLGPGMFGMSVDESGHLTLTHNASDPAPPLAIGVDGHLVYQIGD